MTESEILKIAIDKLTDQFNTLIGECIDENGNPKAPSNKSLAIARACLPLRCSNSYKLKEISK